MKVFISCLKCKWHENFYCFIWKSFKCQKDYRLPFLNIVSSSRVIKVWDLKNYRKNGTKNARSGTKSIKINKICDIMWWTSDSTQSLIILCLGKYLSKSFETLKTETTRHYAKDLWRKLVVIAMMSVPGSFNGYHEMSHNSAITHQSIGILEPKGKTNFLIAV